MKKEKEKEKGEGEGKHTCFSTQQRRVDGNPVSSWLNPFAALVEAAFRSAFGVGYWSMFDEDYDVVAAIDEFPEHAGFGCELVWSRWSSEGSIGKRGRWS